MITAAQDDRRQAYRYRPPIVMEPIFTVINNGRRLRAETVVDINLRGARVTFDDDAAKRLMPGQEIITSVQAPGLDGALDIPSRIVFSASRAGGYIVAMVFIDLPDLAERANADFFEVFNRRQDERAPDQRDISAVVVNNTHPDQESTGFEIRVVNHTTKGLGFVVNRALARVLDGRETLDLAINSSAHDTTQRRTARVLHRAVRSDAVYFGCMFTNA